MRPAKDGADVGDFQLFDSEYPQSKVQIDQTGNIYRLGSPGRVPTPLAQAGRALTLKDVRSFTQAVVRLWFKVYCKV